MELGLNEIVEALRAVMGLRVFKARTSQARSARSKRPARRDTIA